VCDQRRKNIDRSDGKREKPRLVMGEEKRKREGDAYFKCVEVTE
jgi:hypothetical protein